MKAIFALISTAFLAVAMTAPALAQGPTPTPGGSGGGIPVNRDPLPYDFEVYNYDTSNTPMSDNLNLGANFYNPVGSTAITMFSLFDSWNVLGIFVVLLLATAMLWRVHKFTTTSTPSGQVDINIPSGEDEAPEYDLERRYTSNPYKVYRQRLVRRK